MTRVEYNWLGTLERLMRTGACRPQFTLYLHWKPWWAVISSWTPESLCVLSLLFPAYGAGASVYANGVITQLWCSVKHGLCVIQRQHLTPSPRQNNKLMGLRRLREWGVKKKLLWCEFTSISYIITQLYMILSTVQSTGILASLHLKESSFSF